MKKHTRIYILSMTILIILSPALSLWAGATEKKQDEQKEKKFKNRLRIAPVVFYSPETSAAFGVATSYIFRTAQGREDKGKTRTSSISPVFFYTLNKQIISSVAGDIYFKNNNYRLSGLISYVKFPQRFYGIGHTTAEDNYEDFTSRTFDLDISFSKQVTRSHNIGIQYHFATWGEVDTETAGMLDTMNITGVEGGTISGVGAFLSRDTRDNTFFPLRGDFFELNAMYYGETLGSKYEYSSFKLNLRKYINLFSSHIAALQVYIETRSGTVPFLYLPQMGGQNFMRGYYEGRFRDKNLAMIQTEYRFPISGRFRGAVFASVGNVAEKFNDMDLGNLKTAYGFGIRYLFDKKAKIYIRMDVGFGENSNGFYFGIFEAF